MQMGRKFYYSLFRTYVLFGLRTGIPLLSLPLLANALEPSELGSFLASQSLGLLGAIGIQFGFHQQGPRNLAIAGLVKEKSAIVSQILSCQILISILICSTVASVLFFQPGLAEKGYLIAASVMTALGVGLTPAWYFRGTDRPDVGMGYELAGQILSLLLIFIGFSFSGGLGPLAVLFAVGPITFTLLGLLKTKKELSHLPIIFDISTLRLLKTGSPLALVRGSSATLTSGSTWIVSVLTTVDQAAYYGVSIKIITALISLSQPVLFSLLPVISRTASISKSGAVRSGIQWTIALFFLGLINTLILQMFGSHLITLLFPSNLSPAIHALLALSVICPLVAIREGIGEIVMIPLNLDKQVAISVSIGAIVTFSFAYTTVPASGAAGMALARIGGEVTIILLLFVSLLIGNKRA